MNAVAGDETDQAGGNGYGSCNATALAAVMMPWFDIHTLVNGFALSAGGLDDLFVSDFIFHIS